jgi:hypothetical protein
MNLLPTVRVKVMTGNEIDLETSFMTVMMSSYLAVILLLMCGLYHKLETPNLNLAQPLLRIHPDIYPGMYFVFVSSFL